MKQLAITNRICEHLEKYVFDRVWNEPYTEFRTHMKPMLLTKVPVSGIFHGRYSQVQLPINENTTEWGRRYDVYSIESAQFRSIFLNATSWISLASYSSESHLDLQLFTTTGICLHREHVFIRQADMSDTVLLAVDHDMTTALCGDNFDHANLIFGKYHESDYDWDNQIESSVVTYSNLKAWLTNYTKEPIPDGDIRLYNGHYVTGTRENYITSIKINSFIEVVRDADIVGKLTVDCSGNNVPWYHTSEAGTRLLIHVPRSMNPENYLISLNTCDIFLVPTKMVGDACPYLNGVLLYQCGREQYFHQLTHQDFSIDLSLIEQVAQFNGFLQYNVEVLIRKHPRKAKLNKMLIRDANYISYLYHPQHTDEDIVKFLLNKSDHPEMSFWRADHLENGLYAQAIYSRRYLHDSVSTQCANCKLAGVCDVKPNTFSVCPYARRRGINDYIDILGYYHTLALVAKRVTYYELLTDNIAQFVVRGMIALPDLSSSDYVAVVYHNGLRVNRDYVRVESTLRESTEGVKELFTNDIIVSDYSQKHLVIVSNTTFREGDKVTIEIYPDRIANHVKHYKWSAHKFVLTSDPLFVANKDYYTLGENETYVKDTTVVVDTAIPADKYYEKVNNTDNLKIQMETEDQWRVYRVGEHITGPRTDVQYTLIDDPGTFDKENKSLTVSMAYNSYELLVVEGPYTIEDLYSFNIRTTTDASDPLSVSHGYLGNPMYTEGATKFNTFPGDSDVVFLNSKRLIEDLDYTLPNYIDSDAKPGAHLILQNVSYLKPNNVCEVLRTSMTPIVYNRGFLNDDVITWDGLAPFWFDELSTLTIDGSVCSTFTRDLGRITIDRAFHHRNGAPFEICTSAPTQVFKNIGHYKEEDDLAKMKLLREYFYGRHYDPPYRTIVPHEHKVYSIYLEKIIDEYLNNPNFDFQMYANRFAFAKQFADYKWWKDNDLTYRLSEFQLQYVDVYPLYHRIAAKTKDDFTKLAYMIRMLSPAETIKHKDLTNV